MKKKVNYYKIGALVLLLVEIGIAVWVDRGIPKKDIWVWRLYVACIMCIPINVMYICTKRKVENVRKKTTRNKR